MNNQFDPNDQNNQNMNGMNQFPNNVGPEPMNNPALNGLDEQPNMNNQPMDNNVPPMTDPALVGYGPNGMTQQPMNNQMPNNYNQQPPINPTNKQKFNPLIIIVLVVVAVGIVLCAFYFSNGSSNYKAPIEQYCKAFNDLDSESLKNAFPKEIRNNEDLFESMDDTIKSLNEAKKDKDFYFSIKCDISDGEKIPASELKEYNEDVNDEYDVNLKITSMYEVEVKLSMEAKYGDEETSNDLDQTMFVGKVNGKWYILNA